MSRVKCFFYQPSTQVKRYFRRYESGDCPGKYKNFHNAEIFSDEIEIPVPDIYENDERMNGYVALELHSKLPLKCEYCSHIFTEKSEFQLNANRLYFSTESNEYHQIRDLPTGSMYYGDWMLHKNSNLFRGPDGHSLIVILPNSSPWTVDGPANNCTMEGDSDHKCWVRHGQVPNITVDKNGLTCAAGAGSIQSGNYHGFLRNGYLEEC